MVEPRRKLANYDVTLLSCEGSTSKYIDHEAAGEHRQRHQLRQLGRPRVLSHLHFYWLQKSPMFAGTAHDIGTGSSPTCDALGRVDLTINQTFPKGMALAQWLERPVVRRQHRRWGISVRGLEHSVTTVTPPTTEWIYLRPTSETRRCGDRCSTCSFNTPVGTPEAMQCGKAVFTDIHIQKSSASTASPPAATIRIRASRSRRAARPNMMSPQAKALEFLFFDLTSCVEPPDKMPTPPIPQPAGHDDRAAPTTSRPPVVPPLLLPRHPQSRIIAAPAALRS